MPILTEPTVPPGRLSAQPPPVLTGDGLTVRPWIRSDAPVIHAAYQDAAIHRLGLVHSTRNEASCKVALAAGFAPEGTLRGSGKHVDGWHDMHLHARLAG